MRKTFATFTFIAVSLTFRLFAGEQPLKNGDLVFIVNPAGQGKSIQLATKSKYTHVGIVFIEDGKPVVYHAVEPVSRNTFDEFVSMSADGGYQIRRLKDQTLLTEAALNKMKRYAVSRLGVHYDLAFAWDDEQLYCSEYIWKMYNRALNVSVGEPKQLKDFDLSHPAVQAKLSERYGKNIPLHEQMISPGDMFNSELLE
jgi:hypothetical protein